MTTVTIKKTEEEKFLERIAPFIKDDFKVISKYVKSVIPVKITHVNGCGETFSVKPSDFTPTVLKRRAATSGILCPLCLERHKKQQQIELFEGKLKAKHGDDWSYHSEYESSLFPVKIQHSCGEVVSYIVSYLLNPSCKAVICPKCTK